MQESQAGELTDLVKPSYRPYSSRGENTSYRSSGELLLFQLYFLLESETYALKPCTAEPTEIEFPNGTINAVLEKIGVPEDKLGAFKALAVRQEVLRKEGDAYFLTEPALTRYCRLRKKYNTY